MELCPGPLAHWTVFVRVVSSLPCFFPYTWMIYWLTYLSSAGIGCHYMGMFVGALAYADDLTLLAPSPSALRLMLLQYEKFGKDQGIRFNPVKHS